MVEFQPDLEEAERYGVRNVKSAKSARYHYIYMLVVLIYKSTCNAIISTCLLC